jgi:RNA polymerase sigma-70 factor (ECF subfamily)
MEVSTAPVGAGVLADVFASEAAFDAWYARALPRVLGYVFSRCGHDADLAEEITQQAFEQVVRDRARFGGRADPTTWVIAISRHRLADHFRRLDRDERRWQRLVVREVAVPGTDGWAARDEREAVAAALATLPALQRAALIFTALDGLSVREAAALIGKSESATESLLGRARAGFRAAYEHEGDGRHG